MDLPDNWMFLGDGWVAVPKEPDDPNYELAWKCARGVYQENLIRGYEAWSGFTLRGKARDYASKYNKSRDGLLTRLRKAGVDFSFQTIGDRQEVFCIGNITLVDIFAEGGLSRSGGSESPPITCIADLLNE